MKRRHPDSTDSNEKGNTKPSRRGSRKWCFTINNPLYDVSDVLTQSFADLNAKYIFGLEGEHETPHFQGYVEFPNQIRLSTLKQIDKRGHWEPAHGSAAANLKYTSKEHNMVFTNGLYIPEPLDIISVLRPWQEWVRSRLLEKSDGRSIYWYWESIGSFGKTVFIKYMLHTYAQVAFSRAIKSADIITCASIEKNIYLFDVPRSSEGYTPWNAFEQLKDGLVSDSKLKKETRNVIMNSPQIAIFANFPPPVNAPLSADRLLVTNLRDLEDALLLDNIKND